MNLLILGDVVGTSGREALKSKLPKIITESKIDFVNTNRLVRKGTWDIGLSKTGFTRDAGRCLVMQATISNEPVIMIFLNSYGTLTRFADAQRVKKWIKKESIMNKVSQLIN